MPKKTKTVSKGKPVQKKVTSTPVRNSPIPKTASKPAAPVSKNPVSKPPAAPAAKAVSSPPPKTVTYEAISQRAYEIHLSGTGGSELDNWHRAERELRGH